MRPVRILLAVTAAAACAVLTPYAVAHAQTDEVPVEQTDGNPDEVLETTVDDEPVDCNMVSPLPPDEGAETDPAPAEDIAADEPAVAPDEPVATDGDPDEVYCIAASGPGPGPVTQEDLEGSHTNPLMQPAAPAADTAAPVAKPVKARASFTG